MATLYVENVPDDVYAALRKRAKANRKSIAAEVIASLQNIPTEAELKRRKSFTTHWPSFVLGLHSAQALFLLPKR